MEQCHLTWDNFVVHGVNNLLTLKGYAPLLYDVMSSKLCTNEQHNNIHMYVYLGCLQGVQPKMLCNAR